MAEWSFGWTYNELLPHKPPKTENSEQLSPIDAHHQWQKQIKKGSEETLNIRKKFHILDASIKVKEIQCTAVDKLVPQKVTRVDFVLCSGRCAVLFFGKILLKVLLGPGGVLSEGEGGYTLYSLLRTSVPSHSHQKTYQLATFGHSSTSCRRSHTVYAVYAVLRIQ